MREHEDETLDTTRIPVDAVQPRLTGSAPPETIATSGESTPGVSVTQAIRVRRSKNRRPPAGLLSYTPRPKHVRPWHDAAFPTVVSFLFTGPTAYQWVRDGKVLAALLMSLGVAGATFACVCLFSRSLDRVVKSG